MSQPIYKVWFMKYDEPWYKLTAEEQNQLMAKKDETLKQVGCEHIMMCACVWSF
jgi:hypothetical protein